MRFLAAAEKKQQEGKTVLKITNKKGVFYAHDSEAGIEEVKLSVQKNGWCKLPEGNSSNRTWIKGSELEKITDSRELPYREKSVRAGTRVGKKTWVDFLSDEDKALYEQLKAKGEKAREEAKSHKLTEEEKNELKIRKLEAQLAQMKAKRAERVGE